MVIADALTPNHIIVITDPCGRTLQIHVAFNNQYTKSIMIRTQACIMRLFASRSNNFMHEYVIGAPACLPLDFSLSHFFGFDGFDFYSAVTYCFIVF